MLKENVNTIEKTTARKPLTGQTSWLVASTMATWLTLLVSLEAKHGWSGPSLDERPDGADIGVRGSVGGAHPSGLRNIPNAPGQRQDCPTKEHRLSDETLTRGPDTLWSL